jgi:hypothetical protein
MQQQQQQQQQQQTTHVKHAVIQSSLLCMACQRSTTFRFISLHRATQASEYTRQVSLVRTISLSMVLLNSGSHQCLTHLCIATNIYTHSEVDCNKPGWRTKHLLIQRWTAQEDNTGLLG